MNCRYISIVNDADADDDNDFNNLNCDLYRNHDNADNDDDNDGGGCDDDNNDDDDEEENDDDDD